jgi:hypothetical protein
MPYPQNAVLYQIVMDATDNEFLFSFTSDFPPAPSFPHQTAKSHIFSIFPLDSSSGGVPPW